MGATPVTYIRTVLQGALSRLQQGHGDQNSVRGDRIIERWFIDELDKQRVKRKSGGDTDAEEGATNNTGGRFCEGTVSNKSGGIKNRMSSGF